MKIFVDTSAFYTLADEDDRYHHQAKEIYESLIASGQLFTSDYILVECWFLIRSRLGRKAALEFWDGLGAEVVQMIKVELQDLGKRVRTSGSSPIKFFIGRCRQLRRDGAGGN